MKEPAVTAKLVQEINGVHGCYAKKRHSGKFQSGEPDITGCYCGHAFYIEVKMITGALTLLQAHQLEKWRDARATVLVAVYNQADKKIKLIELNETERWGDFIGSNKIKELYDTSSTMCDTLSHFDFTCWFTQNF